MTTVLLEPLPDPDDFFLVIMTLALQFFFGKDVQESQDWESRESQVLLNLESPTVSVQSQNILPITNLDEIRLGERDNQDKALPVPHVNFSYQ